MLTWILVYWILCGLITFNLTQPTVYLFNFPLQVIGEFFLCILLGGLVIPIILVGSIVYWLKVILFDGEE